MATPGIPNSYSLSTTCFGTRLGSIQDQIFAAVGMGFRRLELGLSEAPPSMEGLEESQRETGVKIPSLVAGCRDSLNGSMAAERLASTVPGESERAMNSVRRHIRLAQSWGCETIVLRCGRMEDEKTLQCARELHRRVQSEEVTPELKEEVEAWVQEAQKRAQPQIEQLCRAAYEIAQESPEMKFALEPGRDLHDLLGMEALGWVLDDQKNLGYWHDVGRIHMREKIGLPSQGDWLERFGSRMLGIHMQDAAEEETEMPMGTGEVDFKLLAEYVPSQAEKVIEISPRHGRAEILSSVQFLADLGF